MTQTVDLDKISATILLVEDERRLLQAMSARLGKIGARCIACTNVSEAIAKFAVSDVGLVITDLTMPDIDGLGFVGLIRSQSDIPIIVVTGHSDEYGARLSQYRGIYVIHKPFEFETLLMCVRAHLPQTKKPM
jgi:DNA-binding response OmpR family regulator